MMEERTKNRVILTLGIIAVFLFIFMLSTCNSSRAQRNIAQREMADRIQLEESMDKLMKEKAALEEELLAREEALTKEKNAHGKTMDELSGLRASYEKIGLELEKTVRLKEALENDLKDALMNSTRSMKR
ncbi:MAG: hypothetical protein PHR44_03875 [Candidatus Omnitrophica bacterium]|nr:hypothetical protein [Candidatus Omnitrophota bacterium]